MDREYIQLCAEMAYNDTIVESMLNEEVLQEGAITEKIKKLASGFINAIKTLFGKVFEFLTGLINKIKNSAAAKAIKEKINKLKTKHESAFLYESLLSLVLEEDENEEKSGSLYSTHHPKKVASKGEDYIINYNKIFDHMRSVTDPILKASYSVQSRTTHDYLKIIKDGIEMGELEDDAYGTKPATEEEKKEFDACLEEIRESFKTFNKMSTWGIKFKYVQFRNDNESLDKMADAIEFEYHMASNVFHESLSFSQMEKKLSDYKISTVMPYLYSVGLDTYAEQIKHMFMDCKKGLSESVKAIESVENQFLNIKNVNAEPYFPLIKETLNAIYKCISYFEKGCISSAKVFSNISNNVLSQDHKILALFDI